jgi:IclR family KDG regulon transcriptional repressor
MSELDPPPNFAPSAWRTVQILRAVAAADRPIGASELARMLGLPAASVFRIVVTLEREGFVDRDDSNRYRIGFGAFEVGSAYTTHLDLEPAFRRVATHLAARYDEPVQLAILVGTDVLYIGKADCLQSVRLVSTLGTRLPAHVTSVGKALLSCLSAADLDLLYPAGHLAKATVNSIATLAALRDDLRVIRERGWSHDNEEVSIGLQCVGAAIRDDLGRPLAAMSMAVPTQRVLPGTVEDLGEAVRKGALEVSAMLGYRSGIRLE